MATDRTSQQMRLQDGRVLGYAEYGASQGVPVNDIFDAAKEAGRQLVEDGQMSPETLAVVSRELLPLEMWARATD